MFSGTTMAAVSSTPTVASDSDGKGVWVGKDGKVVGLVEKPENPRSNYAVTGLYFYDGNASDHAAGLRPSPPAAA